MIRNNYMTTGEFAQLMKVSKHTLFHYDDIGLFCPEITMANGYRYYSIYQMEIFETITLLKRLGMSLQEIKKFLEHKSAEYFLNLFDARFEQIDKEIEKLQAMRLWLNERKAKIEYMQKCNFSEVSIVHQPDRYYICREVVDTTDKAFFEKINELVVEFESLCYVADYDIAYMQHKSNIENAIYNQYDNVVLLMKQKLPSDNVKILRKGEYLTAFHIGHWNNIGQTYERLLAYKNAHNITTDGDYLEYYIVDNLTANDIHSYVTEISVRIIY